LQQWLPEARGVDLPLWLKHSQGRNAAPLGTKSDPLVSHLRLSKFIVQFGNQKPTVVSFDQQSNFRCSILAFEQLSTVLKKQAGLSGCRSLVKPTA
jgi:hypothetical protein